MIKTNKFLVNEVTNILPYYFGSNITNTFVCLVQYFQTDNGNIMNQNESKSHLWFYIQSGITLSIFFFFNFDIILTGIKYDCCSQNIIRFSINLVIYKTQVHDMPRGLRAVITFNPLIKTKI